MRLEIVGQSGKELTLKKTVTSPPSSPPFANAGIFGCYRTLDAQFAGVPQRRRRIFFVGHLADWRPACAILLNSESLRGDNPARREKGERIAPTVEARANAGGAGRGTDFLTGGGLAADEVAKSIPARSQMAHREDADNLVAGAVSTKWSKGTGGPAGDECYNLVAAAVTTDARINAIPHVVDVAPTLRAGGNQTGGHRPPGTDVDTADSLIVTGTLGRRSADHPNGLNSEADFLVAAPIQDASHTRANVKGTGTGVGCQGDPMFTLQGQTTHGVIAFDTTQITHPANRSKPDDRSPQLTRGGHPPTIAFDCKAGGKTSFAIGEEVAGTLRGEGHGGGHAAIAFQTRVARNGRGGASDVVPALNGSDAGETSDMRPCVVVPAPMVSKPSHFTRDKDAGPGDLMPPLCADADKGDQDPVLMQGAAVRRLTPIECERLMGLPDNYTLIKFRGKDAADGPRYRCLGNSVVVPELKWILGRIELVDALKK